jgi:uncharacterized metal-binding protein YceD (DUF177 family)
MLVLDVTKIPPEGQDIDSALSAGEVHLEGEESFGLETGGRLRCHVEKGDGESVHVRGRLTAQLGVECSRCLKPFSFPVAQELDLFYLPRVAGLDSEEDAELSDRELVVAYYDAASIDLGEMIREQLFLGVPMKRLCSDGCQGLCPSCGVDRNASSCQCVPEDEHVTPFAKLALKGPNS